MQKYPLQDLLKVRLLREDRALEVVSVARNQLSEAQRFFKTQQEALERYHQFRLTEEERLFDTIMLKQVSREKVDEVKAEIADLRVEELAHEKRVAEAEQKVNEAKKALLKAQLAYQITIKNRQKIEEHKQIWVEEARKADEFALSKELEDFRRHHSPLDDDEAFA